MPLFHLPVFWFGYFDGFKTLSSMIEMKFGIQDFLCLAVGVIFCLISITVG